MHHLVAANLGGRPLDDLAAVVHHRHVPGDGERDVHVVLDQDQRHVGGQPEQQLRQPLALAAARGRRRARRAASACGSTALAMPTSSWRCSPWERSRTNVSVLCAEQHALGGGARPLAGVLVLLAREHPQPPAVVADDGEKDVVLDGEARERACVFWYVRASPSVGRTRAGRCVTSCPITSIVPVDGWKSPATRLNSVVFPAPFGPRIARRSPCATSRSTSRTA